MRREGGKVIPERKGRERGDGYLRTAHYDRPSPIRSFLGDTCAVLHEKSGKGEGVSAGGGGGGEKE